MHIFLHDILVWFFLEVLPLFSPNKPRCNIPFIGNLTLGAASCKKSTRKNKLIRKNKSTRTEIFRYKISVLVDLFFLINLFFSYWLLHEAALNTCFGRKPCTYIFFLKCTSFFLYLQNYIFLTCTSK